MNMCVRRENFAHFLPSRSLTLHPAILTFVYFSMMPSSPLHLHTLHSIVNHDPILIFPSLLDAAAAAGSGGGGGI